MEGLINTSSIRQLAILDLNEDFLKFDREMDFQSKDLEDQHSVFESSIKKQKKSNFNPIFWTNQDEKKLIQLHQRIGNKWTTLSRYFEGSCQNSIKNHFYSRLRKSIRKLNKNMVTLFGKRYPKFNLNIIFKLSNVSEGKVIGKCHVQTQIHNFYKDFIYSLINFSEQDEENIEMDKIEKIEQVENFTLALIALQNLFRIVSGERVYKGKKKNIAYLKRFNFKLDTEAKKTLVISKENCYISDHPISQQSHSEKSSECLISLNFDDQEQQNNLQVEKMIAQGVKQQKTEERAIFSESCQKSYANDDISNTTQTLYPSSPYQDCFMGGELRQYELTMTSDKGKWYDNLLDQYSGNKFHFDIQC